MNRIIESILKLVSPGFRAVTKDPFSVALIKDPSDLLISTAIQKDSRVFFLVQNPSEKISRTAIEQNPSFICLIKNPSESLQLLAISKDPAVIGYIKNPSLAAQIKTVVTSPELIRSIDNPSVEAVKLYIGNDYRKLFNLDLSKEQHENLFTEIFLGEKSWNLSNEDFIFWLSEYTHVNELQVKEIVELAQKEIPDADKMNCRQWADLVTTGQSQIGENEFIVTGRSGDYYITPRALENTEQVDIKKEVEYTNLQTETMKTENNPMTPQLSHLRECLKATRKNINEAVFIGELAKNNIKLEDLGNEQISSLIKRGKTTVNNQELNLKKGPSGYVMLLSPLKQAEESISANQSNMQLLSSTDSIGELNLSDKQASELNKTGKLQLPEGKMISKIKTTSGYAFQVYGMVNSLSHAGQIEA